MAAIINISSKYNGADSGKNQKHASQRQKPSWYKKEKGLVDHPRMLMKCQVNDIICFIIFGLNSDHKPNNRAD